MTNNGFSFIKQITNGSTVHVWSNKRNNTLCNRWASLEPKGQFLKTIEIPQGRVCKGCEIKLEQLVNGKPIKKQKGPKIAPIRPGEQEYLQRWKGVTQQHPSLWEKMDKDPVYASALNTRGVTEEGSTMSNKWGVGRPRGPKGQ
jgi:hypothetical protein